VGIKVIVEGEEHLDGLTTANNGKHQSAVVIANHQR
jgi:lysophosphatidate acyltransferase